MGFNEECSTVFFKSGKKQEIIDRIVAQLDAWRISHNLEKWTKAKAVLYQVRNSGMWVGHFDDFCYCYTEYACCTLPRGSSTPIMMWVLTSLAGILRIDWPPPILHLVSLIILILQQPLITHWVVIRRLQLPDQAQPAVMTRMLPYAKLLRRRCRSLRLHQSQVYH